MFKYSEYIILNNSNPISIVDFFQILGVIITTVLTVIIIVQTRKNTKLSTNMQIDINLYETRLKIYEDLLSILTVIESANTNIIKIAYFNGLNIDIDLINLNNLNNFFATKEKIFLAYTKSKLVFKNDYEIKEYINEIYQTYILYFNNFVVDINKIPKFIEQIKNDNKTKTKFSNEELALIVSDFNKYIPDTIKTKDKLYKLLTNDEFIRLFNKYINMSKI